MLTDILCSNLVYRRGQSTPDAMGGRQGKGRTRGPVFAILETISELIRQFALLSRGSKRRITETKGKQLADKFFFSCGKCPNSLFLLVVTKLTLCKFLLVMLALFT